MAEKRGMSLSAKMLIGMVLGLVTGFVVGPDIAFIKPFGTLFVNLLKMCMVPIVFISLILSIATVDNLKSFGKIGLKTFIFYCFTTICAAIISVTIGTLIQPGVGFTGNLPQEAVVRTMPAVADTLLKIVPVNIIDTLARADLVAIIFFAILFGISISLLGPSKKPLVDVLETVNNAVFKMIAICLKYAPFGVFALMANMTGTYGIDAIRSLGKFLLADYIGYLLVLFIVYTIILRSVGISIFRFLYRVREAIITAATTMSSAATVPVELNLAQTHMGVPKNIAGFMFPFGATVNQNGTAVNVTMCVLFSAQVYGIHFTATELIILIGLALISSIGNSGVPAGGTVFTLMILGQFGIPTEAFGIIIAVYSLVDLGSTTMNICGDMVGAVWVCKTEKLLDEKVWEASYDPDAVEATV